MFDVIFVKETPKAILIRLIDTQDEYWVPRSVVSYLRRDPEIPDQSRTGEVEIESWWIEQNDL